MHRPHSSTSVSHDDNTKLNQGSGAHLCMEKCLSRPQSVNEGDEKIIDVNRIYNFLNVTESGFVAGHNYD